jgi:hypothetical protein
MLVFDKIVRTFAWLREVDGLIQVPASAMPPFSCVKKDQFETKGGVACHSFELSALGSDLTARFEGQIT